MATKVLVSFDDELLARIDEAAQEREISRSAFLDAAMREVLGEPVGPGAHPRARAASRRLKALFAEHWPRDEQVDAAALIRQERDSH